MRDVLSPRHLLYLAYDENNSLFYNKDNSFSVSLLYNSFQIYQINNINTLFNLFIKQLPISMILSFHFFYLIQEDPKTYYLIISLKDKNKKNLIETKEQYLQKIEASTGLKFETISADFFVKFMSYFLCGKIKNWERNIYLAENILCNTITFSQNRGYIADKTICCMTFKSMLNKNNLFSPILFLHQKINSFFLYTITFKKYKTNCFFIPILWISYQERLIIKKIFNKAKIPIQEERNLLLLLFLNSLPMNFCLDLKDIRKLERHFVF